MSKHGKPTDTNEKTERGIKKGGFTLAVLDAVRCSPLLVVLLLLVVLASVILALIPPLVLEKVINSLTDGEVVEIGTALLYFLILLLSGVSDSVRETMITVFGQKITHGVRSALCRKLSRLPASYFVSNDAGKITSRFVNDVDTVEGLFTNGIIGMFADVCKVISLIAIIFVKSRGLGFLIVTVLPLIFLLTRAFQKKILKAQTENRAAVGRMNNFIPEAIRNIRTIHILSKQKYMEGRYDGSITDSYRATEKSNLYDSVYSPIIIMISTVIISVVMVLSATGGRMQALFGMSVGTAVAVIAYVGKVFGPIESIGMEIQSIQSAIAGIVGINTILSENERNMPDTAIDIDMKKNDTAVDGIGCVVFDNVTFGYDSNRHVLEGLSFSVITGEKVTVAGRTGAGKSTMFKLMLGLYEPDGGEVRVCGVPAGRITDGSKRRLFGYVEQAFHTVPGTVADQITLFDNSIDRSQVEAAAKIAGIHDVITSLPGGYDTVFTSTSFSQGQLQLLSIARAVVADPAVMLLDEITANLDSITEREVLNALSRAGAERTVISISHRLYGAIRGRVIEI